MGKETGVTARTVQNCTKRLIKAGHITRDGYSKYGTRYTCLSTRVDKDKVVDGRKGPHQISVNKSTPPSMELDNWVNQSDTRFQTPDKVTAFDCGVSKETFEEEPVMDVPF